MRPRTLVPRSVLAAAALCFPSAGLYGQCAVDENQKLLASDLESHQHFGHPVYLDGDVIVAGSMEKNHDGFNRAGSVYVFRYDGVSWQEEVQLTPLDPAHSDFFGCDAVVDGDLILVGAYARDDLGTSSGCAYVFRHDGSQWVQEAELFASDGEAGDEFGRHLALQGDTALIAASHDDDAAADAGAVYVFEFDGSGWFEKQKLTASIARDDDDFGHSLAIDGDVAVIGVPEHDLYTDSGAAFVFRYDGSQWVEEARVVATDYKAHDVYGTAVAVQGNRIAVGAPNADPVGANSGAVYIHEFNGSKWGQVAKLFPRNAKAGDWFGSAVSLDGDAMACGATWADTEHSNITGAVYVYHFDGSSWIDEFEMRSVEGQPGDNHGEHLGIQGGVVVAGAGHRDDIGHASGAAFVYEIPALGFDAVPAEVVTGETLRFISCSGTPGSPGLLALKELNGKPVTLRIALGVFDSFGEWNLGTTVPPGLAGIVAGFESYGWSRDGKLAAGARHAVTFK